MASSSPEKTEQSQCVIVLGMHRSGTSTLSGTLLEAGLYLGSVLDSKFARNPKGLQEAPSILHMHENLLGANGGSWHEPPDQIKWLPLHKAVRNLFIESRAGHKIWGFKDPRTLLVLEGWLQVLPDAQCVGIFRHPAEVALSIQSRNNFDLGKCFDIWTSYNQKLLDFQRAREFPILEFTSEHSRMAETLSVAVQRLGLNAATEQTFFDNTLKNHNAPDVQIPAAAKQVYDALRECAL